jgi:hypothetical protein
MTSRICGRLRAPIFALALLTLSLFALQAASAPAASAQAKPKIGDPGYEFPDLDDDDFQLFVSMIDYMEKNPKVEDMSGFASANGVSQERMEVVFAKITMNTIGKMTGDMSAVAKEYGSSIVFSPAEKSLYDKYEDKIALGLFRLGMKEDN